ncbi:sensor domain-containing protein [Streptomyces harbinensis]|uniref:sensor histidine kinase n=1 Tax=Streptomyces harbinensis TaxID=1176198 RepID=UPI00159163C8|nr:sensor domain-containing protein [Streptomyces harbinensis]QKV67602.1 sensor domain-containing protein [Streptomyces harbinensis]
MNARWRAAATTALARTVHALLNVVAGPVALVVLLALPLTGHRRWRRAGFRLRQDVLLRAGRAERARLKSCGIADVPDPAGPELRPREGADARGSGAEAYHEVLADTERRAASWLMTRLTVGLPAGAGVLLCWSFGLALVTSPLYRADPQLLGEAVRMLAGAALLALAPWIATALAGWDARTARRLLGPGEPARLAARVRALIRSRASVVEAVDAERRRIERDLHDGVQQQLVALALLLASARRTASRVAEGKRPGEDLLPPLERAHENALQALTELRDVAWRVYPAILDDRGLDAALSALAERSAVPVRIDYRLPWRLPPGIEPVAYFAVSEAVTNAAKHAAADLIRVGIRAEGDRALIVIEDDGVGGADTSGAGLSGLMRRIAAVEGEMSVTSPVGGPTVMTVELPCES